MQDRRSNKLGIEPCYLFDTRQIYMLKSVSRRWLCFSDAVDHSIMFLLCLKDCNNDSKGI